MEIVLSILVLAAFALLAGAAWLWRKGGARKQASLMVVLAIVALLNVAIWTVPQPDGTAPIEQIPQD
ncbi:MAG: hypothetical protein KJZ64_15950 [Sphingomonadaceae bacterium]|nr:hypothetical protein [Sphingomonadaceae bacterium]